MTEPETKKGRVLLTGANGYVALHILYALLERGYAVTGTVRSLRKLSDLLSSSPSLRAYHEAGTLALVVVADMGAPDAWARVFDSAPEHEKYEKYEKYEKCNEYEYEYVVHTATPAPGINKDVLGKYVTDFDREFLEPAVNGFVGLLEAVRKYAPAVKHFTFTGTISSAVDYAAPGAGRVVGPRDWNPVTAEEARSKQDAMVSYAASKTLAEKAAWDWIEEKKPPFTMSVLLPPVVLGPALNPMRSLEDLPAASRLLYGLFDGSQPELQPAPFGNYIDVRDLADLHVAALTNPAAANRRFVTGAHAFSNLAAAAVLSEKVHGLKGTGRVARDTGTCGDGGPDGGRYVLDDADTVRVFGPPKRTFEQTVVDTAERILELEKKFAVRRGGGGE